MTKKKTRDQRIAEENFEFEVKKAEAETKGETLERTDDVPPRTTQEIPSAPGLPF